MIRAFSPVNDPTFHAMSCSLFRPEAIAARAGATLAGSPLPLPPGIRAVIAFVASLAVALVFLLLFGRYAPRETVRGYVTTTVGDVRVHAPGAGTIRRLLVSDGVEVEKGQQLLLIGTARAASRSARVQDAVMLSLQGERETLAAELDSVEQTFAVQGRHYAEEISRLEQRLHLLEEQRQTLKASERLARKVLARYAQLGRRQYVAEHDQDEARGRLHEVQLRQQQLELEIRVADDAIERNRSLLREHPYLLEQRRAALQSSLQRLATRMAEQRGFEEQSVDAPAPGIVTGVLVREGQTVSASSILLSIVPAQSVYQAELLVPARAIAAVSRGASVQVRYDAYPHQEYGTYPGTISAVSSAITLPSDKSFPLPLAEAVYVAQAELDATPAGPGRLQTGMALSADIVLERRRLIEWLLDPLVAAGDRL